MEGINEKRVAEVEKALGIKLYECQRDYIFNGKHACPNERCTGYTTAYCIKLLLTEGEPIRLWEWEYVKWITDGIHGRSYIEWFRKFLIENYERLRAAGIETRIVEFKKVKNGERSQYNDFHSSRFI